MGDISQAAHTPARTTAPGTEMNSPGTTKKIYQALRVLTTLGTAVPGDEVVPKEQVIAARYLLSVFLIDVFLLGVGRIALFEVIMTAEALDHSVVLVSLIMTSAETAIEFVSSAAVPRLYSLIIGTNVVTSRGLLLFAIKAYMTSAILAVMIYPVMGSLMQIAGFQNNATLVLMALGQLIQYPFINQLGDQAIEMALPHWLHTFKGMTLVIPGVPLACCCGGQKGDDWKHNLQAKSTPSSLAVFLTLVRFLLGAIVSVIYVICSDVSALRWLLLIVLIISSVGASVMLYTNFTVLSAGIVDEPVEEEQESTRSLSQMKWSEISLVMWTTMVFKLPSQASSAVVTIMLLSVDNIGTVIYVVGSIAVLYYLIRLLKVKEDRDDWDLDPSTSAWEAAAAERGPDQADGQKAAGRSFGPWERWQVLFLSITLLLCGAVFFLGAFTGVWTIYAAAVCILPYYTLRQSLQAKYEAMLLIYEGLASDIVYWQNVFTVNVNAPLLVLNWWLLDRFEPEDDDESTEDFEKRQASIVMAITVIILVASLVYYVVVDRQLPARASAGKLVNETFRLEAPKVVSDAEQPCGSPLHQHQEDAKLPEDEELVLDQDNPVSSEFEMGPMTDRACKASTENPT